MGLLATWATLTLSMFVATKVLPGLKIEGGIGSHFLVSALFGLVSFLAGWLLFVALGIATLGLGFLFAFLTRLVVSAAMLMLTDRWSSKLSVDGFGTAFLAALIMNLVGGAVEFFLST